MKERTKNILSNMAWKTNEFLKGGSIWTLHDLINDLQIAIEIIEETENIKR